MCFGLLARCFVSPFCAFGCCRLGFGGNVFRVGVLRVDGVFLLLACFWVMVLGVGLFSFVLLACFLVWFLLGSCYLLAFESLFL